MFPDLLRTEGASASLEQLIDPVACERIDIAAEIVVPADDAVHRLGLPHAQPCLAVHRRFWRGFTVAATQQLLAPAALGRLQLTPARAEGHWTPAPVGVIRG